MDRSTGSTVQLSNSSRTTTSRSLSSSKLVPKKTKSSQPRQKPAVKRSSVVDLLGKENQVGSSNRSNESKSVETCEVGRKSSCWFGKCQAASVASVDLKTEKLVSGLKSWLAKRGRPMVRSNRLSTVLTIETPEEPVSKSLASPPPSVDKCRLIEGALEDLRNLISMGFPTLESESWLSAIRSCYSRVTDLPSYWECLALLKSHRGLVASTPDTDPLFASCVESLEEKFIGLEIESPAVRLPKKSRTLRDLSLENVIPSTAINFSVVTSDPTSIGKLVVTPVRRSKRRLALKPEDSESSSYFGISESIREQAVFKPNHSLDL